MCVNVDEAGFPKDRLGVNPGSATVRSQLLLNLHHTDGQHLQPYDGFRPNATFKVREDPSLGHLMASVSF